METVDTYGAPQPAGAPPPFPRFDSGASTLRVKQYRWVLDRQTELYNELDDKAERRQLLVDINATLTLIHGAPPARARPGSKPAPDDAGLDLSDESIKEMNKLDGKKN